MKKLVFTLVLLFLFMCSSYLLHSELSPRQIRYIDSMFTNHKFTIAIGNNYAYYRSENYKYTQEHSSDIKTIEYKVFFNSKFDSIYNYKSEEFKWSFKGLPEGMTFNYDNRVLSIESPNIKPGNYRITVIAESPFHKAETEFAYNVVVEWKTSFLPGINYTFYAPTTNKYGNFIGFGAEFLLYGDISKNDNRGPSHKKLYIKADLLSQSDLLSSTNNDTINSMLSINLGLNLSIERNPERNYFIPYFGLEIGSIYQSQITGDGIFHFTPIGGVWIYSTQNTFIYVSGGYTFVPSKLDELNGYKANLGVNFSLW